MPLDCSARIFSENNDKLVLNYKNLLQAVLDTGEVLDIMFSGTGVHY